MNKISRFNISLVKIDMVESGYGVNDRVTSWKLRLSRIQSLIILLETVNSRWLILAPLMRGRAAFISTYYNL